MARTRAERRKKEVHVKRRKRFLWRHLHTWAGETFPFTIKPQKQYPESMSDDWLEPTRAELIERIVQREGFES